MKQSVIIHSDGACKGNPGLGGYGAILMWKGVGKELSKGFRLTTNNRMELLSVIAQLPNSETEFSVQEIVESSKTSLSKPFSSSNVNQMLLILSESGLVYRNRHGKYAFAVPLLGQFIKRQARAWL